MIFPSRETKTKSDKNITQCLLNGKKSAMIFHMLAELERSMAWILMPFHVSSGNP